MAKIYLPQPIAQEGETFLLQQGYELIRGNNPTPEAFARMKDGSILVNVARGEVVDEQALCHALDAGRPAFAVLDVQKQEPPEPENPLRKREDVLLTPHMASNTEECMARMALHAAWQIHKVLSGIAPDWPVNHPVGV